MPSSTPKQANFMRVVSHNPGFATASGYRIKVSMHFALQTVCKRLQALKQTTGMPVPHVVNKPVYGTTNSLIALVIIVAAFALVYWGTYTCTPTHS